MNGPRGRGGRSATALASSALVLFRVDYGETDLVVTLFTEAHGKLGAIVRGARKNPKRLGGAIEPFHTIHVALDDRGGDLATLREARITQVRQGVVQSLEALEAAGTALRWVRHACPPRTPEPAAWETLTALLDALDTLPPAAHATSAPRVVLATFALRLLADLGYALDWERCVHCGKPCPEGRPAAIDAARGGLVCSSCGGARQVVEGRLRALAQGAQAGGAVVLSPADAETLLALVDVAMAAHAGFDSRSSA